MAAGSTWQTLVAGGLGAPQLLLHFDWFQHPTCSRRGGGIGLTTCNFLF